MIAWGKEIPGTQNTGQREPKRQRSLHIRGHDILTHRCDEGMWDIIVRTLVQCRFQGQQM